MSVESFQIRRAAPNDIDALVELARTTFTDTYKLTDDAAEIEDYVTSKFTRPVFESILRDANSDLYVVSDGERLVGYAHLRQETPPPCVTGPDPIELHRLYLREDQFGKGLGARLVSLAFQTARERNRRTLWLCVYERNQKAIEFYQRCGLIEVGKMEFVFGGRVYLDPAMAATVQYA